MATAEWAPTALERSLARRLVVGSAGDDLQLTPALTRVRELLERLTDRTPAPATPPVWNGRPL
ncbi:hypothetical protein ABZV75_11050 [Streptomyces flaveolus]|uniref:hypothetical protein n=1 Tax=Streptomyces flaveolus TaxID=67297 RepID=UPI0033B94A70